MLGNYKEVKKWSKHTIPVKNLDLFNQHCVFKFVNIYRIEHSYIPQWD